MKKLRTQLEERKQDGGYILLLTILIISIILAISFSIYALSIKEVILASFLKESEKAFTAADRAVECTLYWDRSFPQNGLPYTAFATSTIWVEPANINIVVCDGTSLPLTPWDNTTGRTPTKGVTTFSITYADGTCADVSVTKENGNTSLTSNGYNNCSPGATRRTQRTIQVDSNI